MLSSSYISLNDNPFPLAYKILFNEESPGIKFRYFFQLTLGGNKVENNCIELIYLKVDFIIIKKI